MEYKKLIKRIETKILIHTKEIIKKFIHTFIYRDINLRYQLKKIASAETAQYIKSNMRGIQSVNSRFKVHDIAIKNITILNGEILEFGVFSGGTINYLAKKMPKNKIYGFDSFEGLPDNWRDGFPKGKFETKKNIPLVKKNIHLFQGWFDESIPKYIKQINPKNNPISYLHIDCDLYSSTKIIFELLGKNIVKGTVIVFDEYFNFDGWRDGERDAAGL